MVNALYRMLCLSRKYVLEDVMKDPMNLKFVKEQTPYMCLEAVKRDGIALQYVKEQTPEICLEAIKNQVDALEYVKEQTTELCLEAVKRDGIALQYVKEQTPEICLAAVKEYGLAIYCVKEKTPEICLAAVKNMGIALEYVKEQTPEICLAAVEQNIEAIKYVKKTFKQLIPPEHLLHQIIPKEYLSLPASVDRNEFVDLITLEPLESGKVYGFLVENDQWFLAGSLDQMNEMIDTGFRDSTKHRVFLPLKNALVDISSLKWVKL